jgi:hypothetical protein
LAHENLKPWFYENYIQLYFIPNKRGRYENNEKWLDFYGALTAPKEILEFKEIQKDFFKDIDIIKFIEDCIDKGYYFYTYYDEYFVKPNFMKANRNFVHDLLIYGYDSADKKLTAVGFDDNKVYCSYEIDYEAFYKAFKNGLELTKGIGWEDASFYALMLKSKYDNSFKYEFNITKFMTKFYDFLHSVNTGKNDYPETETYYPSQLHYLYTLKENVYGIDTYDAIIAYLKKTMEEKSLLLYVMFHTLYEHKVSIIDRLQYISDEFRLCNIRDIVNDYEHVVCTFDQIRLLALKYNKLKKESILIEMISNMERVKSTEKALLSKAYDRLYKIDFGGTKK